MPELRVHRGDLRNCEVIETSGADPADGEALLRVERFALTTNNITYARLGDQLGDDLRRSTLVGLTHGPLAPPDGAPMPGPTPAFFFAPQEMVRRRRELAAAYPEAWRRFAPVANETMRIVPVNDADGLRRTYLDLLDGRVDPAVGHVVTLA